MDLGLRGRTAIVCAASRRLGRACAEALAAKGVDLILNARNAGPLEQSAAEIAAGGHGDARFREGGQHHLERRSPSN